MKASKKGLRLASVATMLISTVLTPLAASATSSPPAAQAATRPNIVLIVFDDVGFSDFGAFGSEIRTPHIDALANEGLRYNRFDTKAVCSSTRAALLTGRNNQTVGMEDLASYDAQPDPKASNAARGELPRNAETIAQALKASGYSTWALGKWHLAPVYDEAPGHDKGSWPRQRGFDHFYGFLSGWTDQYKPDLVEDNAHVPVPSKPDYLLTPDLVDHAIAAFDADKASDSHKPSFVYLALGTAHSPIQAPRSYIDAYGDLYAKGWDAIRSERFERLKKIGVIPADTVLPPINPGDRPWSMLSAQEKTVFARFMAAYAGFITHADDEIGRLVDHLKQTGQYDNTLFVLLSDNGAAPESGQQGGFWKPYDPDTPIAEMAQNLDKLGGPDTQSLYQRPWAMAGVTPFRRYKLWPYAGGVRTPLIISWANGIKARGIVRHQYVDAIDIGPTLLDVAGTQFHDTIEGVQQLPIAGRSIKASFTSASARGRDVQFFSLRGNRAITQGKWKAVAIHRFDTDFENDRWELFDTSVDFSESQDVSKRFPEKLKELKALWWSEARKYSDPPLAEPSEQIRSFHQFDDAFPIDGTTTTNPVPR